jgi:hypothetical protein
VLKTGDDLTATVRILPSYNPAGGYDSVDARVEVTYPLRSVGNLLAEKGLREELRLKGEVLDRRSAALTGLNVPTATATFPLFDDGTHGDLHAGNAYWSGRLSGLGAVDGAYRFRFLLDLTRNGCTTHRELSQTYVVDLAADPEASRPRVGDPRPAPGGGFTVPVDLRPSDRFGNLWGPGRPADARCAPRDLCRVDPQGVLDHGDGSYTVRLDLASAVGSVALRAFGGSFVLPVPCKDCPRLAALVLADREVSEHGKTTGLVRLTGPAPAAGATVYLASSNRDAAQVPESVAVPAGQVEAKFPIHLLHAHDGPAPVVIGASYGKSAASARLTVRPLPPPARVPPGPPRRYPHHGATGGHEN